MSFGGKQVTLCWGQSHLVTAPYSSKSTWPAIEALVHGANPSVGHRRILVQRRWMGSAKSIGKRNSEGSGAVSGPKGLGRVWVRHGV